MSKRKLVLQEVFIAIWIISEEMFPFLDRTNPWSREIKNRNCFPRKEIVIEWKFNSRKWETSPTFLFDWLPMLAVILSGRKLFPLVSGGREVGRLSFAAKTRRAEKSERWKQLHSAMISTINLHLVRMFETLVSSEKIQLFFARPRTTSLSIRFD